MLLRFLFIFLITFNLQAAYTPTTTVSGTVAVSNFPLYYGLNNDLIPSYSVLMSGSDGGNQQTIAVDGSGYLYTTIVGGLDDYATGTRQDTGNTYLGGIQTLLGDLDLAVQDSTDPVEGHGLAVGTQDSLNTFQLLKSDTSGNLHTKVNSALPAGSAIIGKVGIDQTSVGTTNGVALAQVGFTTTATGNGVTGLGSQRVTIASDNTAFSVNANAGTNLNTSALNLETTQTAMSAKLPSTLGTKTAANSFSVTIASDDARRSVSAGTVPVIFGSTPSVSTGTVPVTGTVALSGTSSVSAGTVPVTGTFFQSIQPVSTGTVVVTYASTPSVSAGTVPITGSVTITGTASVSAGTVPVNATLTAETTKVIGTVNVAAAQTIATTNAGTFAVQNTEVRPASATLSNVASSATSVTCLASNSARRQASFYNDSTQSVYLKFGVTASSTSYTVLILAGGFYEIPSPVYTGIVDCIWVSANGNMRVTEW